jgi:hypothetical protein
MAKTKGIDKNDRVVSIIKPLDKNMKYGSCTVELVDGLYFPVSAFADMRGNTNDQINALIKTIESVEAKTIEEYKAPKQWDVWGSTIAEMHQKINNLVTEEGWNQYKAGVLVSLRQRLADKQETLKAVDKEHRKEEAFIFNEPNLLVSNRSCFVMKGTIHIDSAVVNKIGVIATTDVNVEEWKKAQITQLQEQMLEIEAKIKQVNDVDAVAMQTWYNNLREVAIKYIETGVMD